MGFVLDRSMLQAARGVLQSEGMTPERAAAALSSISFDNYRYGQPVVYSHEAMAPILAAYRSAGWKHLVDAHEPRAGSETAVELPQTYGCTSPAWISMASRCSRAARTI